MKAVVAAFNQEKALVGAFSVITNLRMQFGCNFLKHYCQGIWAPLENTWYEAAEDYTTFRDCWDYDPPDHLQPLSRYSSKVRCRYLDNISISNFLGA